MKTTTAVLALLAALLLLGACAQPATSPDADANGKEDVSVLVYASPL